MHGLFRNLAGEGARFAFDGYMLDVARRELQRGEDLQPVEPQVFDILVFLIQHRDRVVSKDDLIQAVWGGRVVSESTLTSRINAVRRVIGDNGQRQHLIRTFPRKGVRFVGDVTEVTASPAPPAPVPRPPLAGPPPSQQVRFCAAADGARIAYAIAGSGPPLIKAANWLSHIEYEWQSPVWSHLLHALTAEYRLIRYDERGNGLSDWDADISFEAFVRDLESVADAAGVDKFALLGVSGGCSVSIAYALRHPERVTHLVLYGGAARGRRKRGEQQAALSDALHTLMLQGWGQENPAFRQLFTSMFIPGGTAEQAQWFNDLQRNTTSPENAVRLTRAREEVDIERLLPELQVPTLVLHRRGDALVPFEEGRRMAAAIKGARFVALEGGNHLPLEGEPATGRMLEEIANFLK